MRDAIASLGAFSRFGDIGTPFRYLCPPVDVVLCREDNHADHLDKPLKPDESQAKERHKDAESYSENVVAKAWHCIYPAFAQIPRGPVRSSLLRCFAGLSQLSRDILRGMEGVTLTSLKGRSVLVTGGASGIGRACADAFAAAGAYVTIADIQPEEPVGREIVEQASIEGQHVNYVYCNTTNWQSQVAAFKSAVRFSPQQVLDIVVLSAGVASNPGNIFDHLVKKPASLEDEPAFPLMQCMDVNLTGVYYSAHLALDYMRLQPSASSVFEGNAPAKPISKSLIFVDSMAGFFDFPQHTGYNVSKSGCRALFRSIRSTTRAAVNVRCNLIAPWFVKTALTTALQAQLPKGRGMSWTDIDEVTLAIVTCAVDEAIEGKLSAI